MPVLTKSGCPRCGSSDVSFSINLFIHAPMRYWYGLSKEALRDKEVSLQGADWSNARIWCNSCNTSHLKREE